MNYAFDNLIMSDIISVDTPISCVKVEGGKQKTVNVGLVAVAKYPLTTKEAQRLCIKFNLPESVSAPVKKGERIGKVHIYLDNRLLFSEDLFTMDNVEELSFWDKIGL